MSKAFPSIAPEDLAPTPAEELGFRVKLLGVAVRTAKGIEQRCTQPWCRIIVDCTSDGRHQCGNHRPAKVFRPIISVAGTLGWSGNRQSAVVADIADRLARHFAPNRSDVRRRRSCARHKKAPMERHEGMAIISLDGARSRRYCLRPSPTRLRGTKNFHRIASCNAMPTVLKRTAPAGGKLRRCRSS